MEIVAYFSDIQTSISDEIKKAKYNIFVAVAWITDKSLWTILETKAKEGVVVQVILVPDEINNNNSSIFDDFSRAGIQIFWDDHHHKFCVIDIKTVITGSYNWTYMASNRGKRENIVILKGNADIAEQFSDEFKLLLKGAQKHALPLEKEFIFIEKPIEREVVKIVEKEVIQYIDREVKVKVNVKEDVNKFTMYEKVGKFKCGKCHSNKIIIGPKAPKNIQSIARYYCKDCNTYYDANKMSI
jgi:phosphatidylserine/phosphatidylglycerophosphate/cardiolipin synthase-like enzyme